MAFEHKELTGNIFKNDKKGNDKAPDYKGVVKIEGKEWDLALWVTEGAKGKYFSVKASEPFKKTVRVAGDDDTRPRGKPAFDDDLENLPF